MEQELRKAFEEVTTRNVKAVVEHSNETRRIVREFEDKITTLVNRVRQYDDRLNILQTQLSALQARTFAGGTE